LKIVFAGTTVHAAEVLKHLASSMHEVVSVLTREDAPVGRKGILTPSPVAELAASLSLPLIKANKVGQAETDQISALQPDLGIVIAYGALLKKPALAAPKNGWLNLHFSVLPAHRGAAPVQHSILSGETETGVSIFKLDEGMDTGPILTTVRTLIQPDEDSGDLLGRLTSLGISAVDECLAQIDAGIAKFVEQTGTPSFAGKLTRNDAKIDWNLPAKKIELLVRAMNPEPMAWATISGQPFRIIQARSSQLASSDPAGTVAAIDGKVFATCGDNSLLQLIAVQPSGKNVMTAADWLRGQKENVIFDG
jgi:methionyl-tRNA formyltransferase